MKRLLLAGLVVLTGTTSAFASDRPTKKDIIKGERNVCIFMISVAGTIITTSAVTGGAFSPIAAAFVGGIGGALEPWDCYKPKTWK